MLVTKCVDDYKMLVAVLAILVTNIHFLFSVANQHLKDWDDTNIIYAS